MTAVWLFGFIEARHMGKPAERTRLNLGVYARLGKILDRKFLKCMNYLLLNSITCYETQNSSLDMDTLSNPVLTASSGPQSLSGL